MATKCCGRSIIIDELIGVFPVEPPEPPVEPDLIYYITTEDVNIQFSGELFFNSTGQTGTIDWGDGNTEPFDSGVDAAIFKQHIYAIAGDYEIKFYLDSPPAVLGFEDTTTAHIGTDIYLKSPLINFDLFGVGYAASFADIPEAISSRPLDMRVIRMRRSVLVNVDLTDYENLETANFESGQNLISLDVSGITTFNQVTTSNSPLFTTLNITGCTEINDVRVDGCALDSTAVDDLLILINSMVDHSGDFDSISQTPPAPRTAASDAAYNNLTGVLNWNVLTDS